MKMFLKLLSPHLILSLPAMFSCVLDVLIVYRTCTTATLLMLVGVGNLRKCGMRNAESGSNLRNGKCGMTLIGRLTSSRDQRHFAVY